MTNPISTPPQPRPAALPAASAHDAGKAATGRAAAGPSPVVRDLMQTLDSVGVDRSRLASVLGAGYATRLESMVERLSHTDRRVLQTLHDVSRVPGSMDWREALDNVRRLDAPDQGRALAALAARIEHVPDAQEKLQLTDHIVDAVHELRGTSAVDAMWGLARGVGAAERADPAFAQRLASRD